MTCQAVTISCLKQKPQAVLVFHDSYAGEVSAKEYLFVFPLALIKVLVLCAHSHNNKEYSGKNFKRRFCSKMTCNICSNCRKRLPVSRVTNYIYQTFISTCNINIRKQQQKTSINGMTCIHINGNSLDNNIPALFCLFHEEVMHEEVILQWLNNFKLDWSFLSLIKLHCCSIKKCIFSVSCPCCIQ